MPAERNHASDMITPDHVGAVLHPPVKVLTCARSVRYDQIQWTKQ